MAFPTTSVLDTFSGTLGGWTTPAYGDVAFSIVSGQVTPSSNTWGGGVWTTTVGPDCEVFVDIPTLGLSTKEISLRWRGDSASAYNGYSLRYTVGGSPELTMFKSVAGAATGLGNITQAMSAGDSLGVSMIDTAITVYYKASGGSWASIGSATDSTFTGSGYIGLEILGNLWKLDNFGGGTLNQVNQISRVRSQMRQG